MGRPNLPARRIQLALTTLVVAYWLYWWWFTLHWWPLRLFIVGFAATGGTAVFMANARQRHGDRHALVPCLIGIAGVAVQFILLSRTPQPLTLAGCIGLAIGAVAWAVRLVALLVTRRASAAAVTRSPRAPEGA